MHTSYNAFSFLADGLERFSVDASSPEYREEGSGEVDYEILSKVI